MNFPIAIYLLAFFAAFGTALGVLPLWRKWCLRVGLVDDPGHRKIHEKPVPLAGGLAVITALVLPTLLALLALWGQRGTLRWEPTGSTPSPQAPRLFPSSFLEPHTADLLAYGLNRRSVELVTLFAGAVGMFCVGLLDDKRELRPAAKFAGQFLVALAVAAAGVRVTLFVPNLLFSYAVTCLWILTVTNAFNFMDNMNGLCGGLGVVGSLYFAVIAAQAGQYLVALIAFLACGALLGFLPWNFPHARAFLGDAGSHLVGFLLAVLAILPHFYTRQHPHALAVLSPLLILAVPLGDLVWVVILRWRMGRPFYVGDTNHLSHRLVRLGLSRALAVVLIWILASAIGALALI